MFRTIYYPANPYGGEAELKEFVKQEMVYPPKLFAENVNGEVFITYLVDSKGEVIYKEVIDQGDSLFQKEAERIFDKILWEKDPKRKKSQLGYEKIQFIFKAKKYKKLVKKRGYDQLPFGEDQIYHSSECFNINQLDSKAEILNANSINEFIVNNIKYPPIAYSQGISGRVSTEFVIEPYGLSSNVRIIEPLAGGCNEETVHLIKSMKWKPGMIDGKAVRTLFRYELNFVHPGGTVR